MSNNSPIPFEEGDFVIHPKYNKGLTTYIDQLSTDKSIATIRIDDSFVSVPVSELTRYVPE